MKDIRIRMADSFDDLLLYTVSASLHCDEFPIPGHFSCAEVSNVYSYQNAQ